MSALTPVEFVQSRIQLVRDVRVILDTDLAKLYRVSTSRLNEAVKRNSDRFPADFRFQLTPEEVANLRSQIAISSGATLRAQSAISNGTHGGRRSLPYAFTEYGALMAANVLNSAAAVTMSVQVIRAFIQLRQLLVNHTQLAAKLTELDARVGAHDSHLAEIIAAIRKLAAPEGPRHRRKIGFHSPAK
ncbi:MAG: ORF6N domain-containing protein [Opitutaceae bacterium]